MRILETECKQGPDSYEPGEIRCVSVDLTAQETNLGICLGGEIEDQTIDRDLACVYDIKDMLVAAYNAGVRGETIEIFKETEEE